MSAATANVGTTRRLLKLSLPLAGTQLAGIALAATDTAVLGHLGVPQLAGGGLAVLWFNQLRTMAVGLLTPLGNRIAETDARPDLDEDSRAQSVRELSRLGLLLATAAGVLGAGLLILIGLALPYLGQSHGVSQSALPVMIALAPGLVPCLWFQAIRQFTVGLERAQALFSITLGSVVLNFLLDLLLGYGLGPFPGLAAAGVGLATTLVHLCTAGVFVGLVRRDERLREHFDARPGRVSAHVLRAQLRLGIPVAATYGAEAGMFSALAMIMGSFGADALAAHNVVYQVTFIVFQIGVGFSHGGSILISRCRATDDVAAVRGVGVRMLTAMAGVVGAAGILFTLAPRLVLRPFLGRTDAHTMHLSITLLLIGVLMEFADTAQNLGIGALRGLGDTRTGLRASLVGYWLVGLPIALVLAFSGLGPPGIWWGLICGLATASLLLWHQFLISTRR